MDSATKRPHSVNRCSFFFLSVSWAECYSFPQCLCRLSCLLSPFTRIYECRLSRLLSPKYFPAQWFVTLLAVFFLRPFPLCIALVFECEPAFSGKEDREREREREGVERRDSVRGKMKQQCQVSRKSIGEHRVCVHVIFGRLYLWEEHCGLIAARDVFFWHSSAENDRPFACSNLLFTKTFPPRPQ